MRNAQTSMAGHAPHHGGPAEEYITVMGLLTEAGLTTGSMTGLGLEWLLDRVESRGTTP